MIDERVKFTMCAWNSEAEALFEKCGTNYAVADIKKQVDDTAVLFRMSQGEQTIMYYVLRVDDYVAWSEGVVIAAAGHSQEFDITKIALPLIEQQFTNCKYVRIHTARAGLVKKLASIGYEASEFIMRKALHV